MAALWTLPLLVVIENNQYGMGTAVSRSSAGQDLADRGSAYGIPGKQVDGMDVLAVRAAASRGALYCRSGKGPFILEMKPIGIVAIQCLTLPNTAPETRLMPCVNSMT